MNIALVEAGIPRAGVVYAPVTGACYYTGGDGTAWKAENGREPAPIAVDRRAEGGIVAVTSRSHSSEEEKRVLEGFGVSESISVGSSLKFCMVAEGRAHVYYRHGPTMEWDTAAGHAVAAQAGASVTGLRYNKESLLNGSFLVTAAERPAT